MDGIAILTFLGVAIVYSSIIYVIFKAIQQLRKRRETDDSWKLAGRTMGVSYSRGLLGNPALQGRYNGFRVLVTTIRRGGGSSQAMFTRFCVFYPYPLNLGLRLTREVFFSRIAKFFGSQDIQVGDPRFDDQVMVKGFSERRVRKFLTPARRLRIMRFLTSAPGAMICDDHIVLEILGVVRDARRIQAVLRRMTRLAACLTAEPEADRKVEETLRLRRQGKVEEAIRTIREAPPADSEEPEKGPPDPEKRVLEAELLEIAGRKAEARKAIEHAREEEPEDEDVRRLAERIEAEPAPPPSFPATDLDVASVCNALFEPGVEGMEGQARFDSRYRGRTVRWKGTLRSVEPFSFDLVFGNDPGTRAVLEVFEVDGGLFGARKVQVIAAFPSDAKGTLQERIGTEVEFEGELVKCDHFMRNLFARGARLV